MTDNEIIVPLKCFVMDEVDCSYCKYKDRNGKCKKFLYSDVLGLIDENNRQKAEIERLEEDKEQLKADNEMFTDIGKMYSELKADAIKEFAERLKENKIDIDVSFGYGREVYTEAVAVIEIDNLVKEMVGAE